MIPTSDFKRNLVIEFEGKPWQILDVSVSTPSARNANTIVRTKMKCLLDGPIVEKPFRSGDRVPEPDVERRDCQYLYTDDRFAHFMDLETYDQFQLARADLGDQALYLHDGMADPRVLLWNGNPVQVELPAHVELTIEETDPPMKGVTASAQTKAAKLSTGLVVQVPAYLGLGETIRVDTRTGAYVQRVSK